MSAALLAVRGLRKEYPLTRGGFGRSRGGVRAVNDVSFDLAGGETLSLVGESGCGKTTTAKCVLRLVEPSAGSVQLGGRDLLSLAPGAMRAARREAQFVFQDPYASLNPRMTAGDIVAEPLRNYGLAGERGEREDQVAGLLRRVGLRPEAMRKFPHEFSGGQRQRLGIARALALKPRLIVCDEPVSALDVSVQAQVINLLTDLQQELGISYLFIAHDLGVVRHISHRVAVMYLGRIVEIADRDTLFDAPRHPYTQVLLSSVPAMRPGHQAERVLLQGEPPSPANPPAGCAFHTRCPLAQARCREEVPALSPREGATVHHVACHFR